MQLDYETTIYSKGNTLNLDDKYLVANDGTFVFPEEEDIYDFLVREYWPDELANTDGLHEVMNKEFKVGAYSVFDEANCDWHWNECSVEKVLHEYGLDKGAVKNA